MLFSMAITIASFDVAFADSDDNVVGYAFSDMPDGSDQSKPCNGATSSDTNPEHCGRGIGWISLNNINNGGSVGYGVKLDRNTGNFEGHGYAPNGGWVKFNPSMTGVPTGPGTTATGARVDPGCLDDINRTCKVTGWIRFTAPTGANSDWDGWVSLSGTGYGLELDKPDANGVRKFMSGGNHYAWGASIVGWVDFSHASVIYDMCLNTPEIETTVPVNQERLPNGTCKPLQDFCPTTNYQLPGSPLNGKPDPKTTGYETTLPVGYTTNIVNGVSMCGVWGCAKTDPSVTINDSSMCDDLPPPPPPIKGCKDPKAENYNELATIADTSCIYKVCPNTGLPPVGGVCPGEICGDGIDTDGDTKDPVCPPKGPKQPVYCETGSDSCVTNTQPQS